MEASMPCHCGFICSPAHLDASNMFDTLIELGNSSSCLVRGNGCEYLAAPAAWRPPTQQAVKIAPASVPEPSLMTALSAAPSDPFDSLSIDMPYASPNLFRDCRYLNPLDLGRGDNVPLRSIRLTLALVTTARQRVRTSFPNYTKQNLLSSMSDSEPAWFRACLLLTAGRAFLLSADRPASFREGAPCQHQHQLFKAYLHHKTQTLHLIRQKVQEATLHSLGLVTAPIMYLMLAAFAIGEEGEAMAHLQGLFSVIQSYEKIAGPRVYITAFRKVPIM
jgi:hypothetical protein